MTGRRGPERVPPDDNGERAFYRVLLIITVALAVLAVVILLAVAIVGPRDRSDPPTPSPWGGQFAAEHGHG